MTEQTEIKKLKTEINKLKKLIQDQTSEKSRDDKFIAATVASVKEILEQQAQKPKKEKWGDRTLVAFPDGHQSYVTPDQMKVKELVDSLIESNALSTVASETSLNTFFRNDEIQKLDRSTKFWAKQYYKSQYLKFPKSTKREVGHLG